MPRAQSMFMLVFLSCFECSFSIIILHAAILAETLLLSHRRGSNGAEPLCRALRSSLGYYEFE